jgi:2-polyprenyl-3-methyl-5-hydroxy-6-metoxy-1,4-benzoquinol methylase
MTNILIKFSLIRKKILGKFYNFFFGGRQTRNFLKKILKILYKKKFLSDWYYSKESPHFYDFEEYEDVFSHPSDYNNLQRGYWITTNIKENDLLCDIGCGSGFFTKRFYSFKCKSIDAIDIEKTAIDYAKKYNKSKKINYFLFDILKKKLPRLNYNVIVLNGALGHFSQSDNAILLKKISNGLHKDGLFIGSEAIGRDDDDHLQIFKNKEELKKMLKVYFKYIDTNLIYYPIKPYYNSIRSEAYWIASNTIKKASWNFR